MRSRFPCPPVAVLGEGNVGEFALGRDMSRFIEIFFDENAGAVIFGDPALTRDPAKEDNPTGSLIRTKSWLPDYTRLLTLSAEQ